MKVKGKEKRTLTKIQTQIRKKRFKQFTMALSAVVVFCVTYALILPAITISSATYCKQEEHEHISQCYVSKTPLCGLEEEAIEGHSHDDSCYETNEEGEKVLICTKAETASTTGHTHSKSCYSSADPICGIEEHTHTRQCYSNTEAVEDESDWKASVPEKLDDDLSKAIIQVAKSQKDYKESEDNFEVQEDESEKGYTRYGNWADDSYGDWNNYFTGFVLKYAGVDLDDLFYNKVISTWNSNTQSIQKTNLEDLSEGNIVFYLDEESNALSTGIVNEIDEKDEKVEIYTGDQEEKVDLIKIKNESITGYLQAKEKEETSNNSQEEKTEQQASQDSASQSEETSEPQDTTEALEAEPATDQATSENLEEKTLIYKDERMQIIVSYSDAANIPENAKLQVENISEEKDTFDSDISIISDGKEIEPDVPVTVSIKFLDGSFKDRESLSLIHYLYEKEVYETIDATRSSDEDGNPIFTYTAFSFSETVATEDPSNTKPTNTITVYLEYRYENGQTAFPTQKFTFGQEGNILGYAHSLPKMVGYEAIDDNDETITSYIIPVEAKDGQHYTIKYAAAKVNYWLAYYQQCVPGQQTTDEMVTSNDHEFAKYITSDDKTYEFVSSILKKGRTGRTVAVSEKEAKGNVKAKDEDEKTIQETIGAGFTVQEVQTDVAIAADGSTVLNLYYNRDTYQITAEWKEKDSSDATKDTTISKQFTYVYGQTFEEPSLERSGYYIEGWYISEDFEEEEKIEFGSKKVEEVFAITTYSSSTEHSYTIYPKWVAKDTTFTVKVWVENPNAAADITEDSPKFYNYVTSYSGFTGKTGEPVSADTIDQDSSDDTTIGETVKEKLIAEGGSEYDYYSVSTKKTDTVVLAGDGTSSLDIYYVPNTYTLRFYYAMKTVSGGTTKYYVPSSNTPGSGSTDGISTDSNYTRFSANCSWTLGTMYTDDLTCLYYGVCWYQIADDPESLVQNLPTSNAGTGTDYTDTVVNNTEITYYYIYITAKYGEDIYSLWPSKEKLHSAVSSSGSDSYAFMSWGCRYGSPYLSTDTNINGVYGEMDNIMVPEKSSNVVAGEDGANPVQKFVSYWSLASPDGTNTLFGNSSTNRTNYKLTYNIWFSTLSTEIDNTTKDITIWNEKSYTKQFSIETLDTSPATTTKVSIPNFSDVVRDETQVDVSEIMSFDGKTVVTETKARNTYSQTIDIYYTRKTLTVTLMNKEGKKIEVAIPYGENLQDYKVTSYVDYSNNDAGEEKTCESCSLQSIKLADLTDYENRLSFDLDEKKTADGKSYYYLWSYEEVGSGNSDYNEDLSFDFDVVITRNLCLVPKYKDHEIQVNFYLKEEDSEPFYTAYTTYKSTISSGKIKELDDRLKESNVKSIDYWRDEAQNKLNIETQNFDQETTNLYAVYTDSNACTLRINYWLVPSNGEEYIYFYQEKSYVEGATETIASPASNQFAEIASEIGLQNIENQDQNNYYPRVASSTVILAKAQNSTWNEEENCYVLDLYYDQVPNMKYFVKYIRMVPDANGNYVESTDEPISYEISTSQHVIVTSIYGTDPEGKTLADVEDLLSYDMELQKTLLLTSTVEENVITFRYVDLTDENTSISKFLINYWKQDSEGGYTLFNSGQVSTSDTSIDLPAPISIDGYTFSKTEVLKGIYESEKGVHKDKHESVDSEKLITAGVDGKYQVPNEGMTINYYFNYEQGIDIIIQKTWEDGTPPENISFTLYKVDKNANAQQGTITSNIEITSDNSWQKTITVPKLSADSQYSYALVENTGGYIVSISGDGVNTPLIDNKLAAVFNGTEETTINFSNQIGKALPSTGGAGTNVLTYTGVILCGSALAMYEYDKKKSKRERRKNNTS